MWNIIRTSKMYAISWNISSNDGERVLSIWTTRERAESEFKELDQIDHYMGGLRIVEIKIDTHNGVENAL